MVNPDRRRRGDRKGLLGTILLMTKEGAMGTLKVQSGSSAQPTVHRQSSESIVDGFRTFCQQLARMAAGKTFRSPRAEPANIKKIIDGIRR